MRIVYLHGLESGPMQGKALRLQEAGHVVSCPLFPSSRERLERGEGEQMFEQSIAIARRAIGEGSPDLVVGSSFGGAVGHELLRLDAWGGPMLLLCPAWRRFGRGEAAGAGARLLIVHGAQDELVPLGDSRDLAAHSGAELIVVQDDHRLSGTASVQNLDAWARQALAKAGT